MLKFNIKSICSKCGYHDNPVGLFGQGDAKTIFIGSRELCGHKEEINKEHLHRICSRCNFLWTMECKEVNNDNLA